MAKSVTFKGTSSLQPGVFVEEAPLPTGLKSFNPPERLTTEESIAVAMNWIREEINHNFVGSYLDPQTREEIKHRANQALNSLKAQDMLPVGVNVSNVRLEGDTLKADIYVPRVTNQITNTFSISGRAVDAVGHEEQAPVKKTIRTNLTRPGAPWEYE